MRFVSWNVNGLRAVVKKGFGESFESLDADIVALQETKLQEGQIDLDLPGYFQFWSYAERKGYSGTAVFVASSRFVRCTVWACPSSMTRVVSWRSRFPTFWFVDVYTPNAQNELARIDHRMAWDDAFRDFCKGLEQGRFLPACPCRSRPWAKAMCAPRSCRARQAKKRPIPSLS